MSEHYNLSHYPQPGYEYKWWGHYGPKHWTSDLADALLSLFIGGIVLVSMLVLIGIIVMISIAVPPVGIAILTRGEL